MQLTANRWSVLRERIGRLLSALDPPLLLITTVLLSLATLVMASATADFMSVAVYSLSITLSERATASRRARTREAQLLDLVDGSIQGILIHREFRPLYANRRAAELLGFHSVADLMAQRSLAGIVVPDDLARISSEQSRRQLAAGRMVCAAVLTAFWSRGVNARSACCTRLPSWASTLSGTSSGFCVTKYTPTPLERMRRTTCSIFSSSAGGASLNSR